jgi:hypothetical protein
LKNTLGTIYYIVNLPFEQASAILDGSVVEIVDGWPGTARDCMLGIKNDEHMEALLRLSVPLADRWVYISNEKFGHAVFDASFDINALKQSCDHGEFGVDVQQVGDNLHVSLDYWRDSDEWRLTNGQCVDCINWFIQRTKDIANEFGGTYVAATVAPDAARVQP